MSSSSFYDHSDIDDFYWNGVSGPAQEILRQQKVFHDELTQLLAGELGKCKIGRETNMKSILAWIDRSVDFSVEKLNEQLRNFGFSRPTVCSVVDGIEWSMPEDTDSRMPKLVVVLCACPHEWDHLRNALAGESRLEELDEINR